MAVAVVVVGTMALHSEGPSRLCGDAVRREQNLAPLCRCRLHLPADTSLMVCAPKRRTTIHPACNSPRKREEEKQVVVKSCSITCARCIASRGKCSLAAALAASDALPPLQPPVAAKRHQVTHQTPLKIA